MAVSKENSQYGKASDFYEDISEVCEPCCVEGKRLQADRFCVECQEHLCQKCSAHHTALKATRSHVLVTIDDAKKAKPVASKDKCSANCTLHTGKSINYYCVTHSYLGCSVCFTIDHKQCKSIDYIPKVAEDIRNLDGFKKFDKNLKFLESSCKSSIADVEKNLKQLSEDERQMKEAVKELRKKINEALDTLENELTTQATKINHEETKILNALSNKLTTTLGNVDALLNQVVTLLASGKNCDTYVLMKKEASHLVALNDELVNTTKGKTFQRYEFQPNNEIFKAGAFGKMSCRKENISPSSEKRVAISSTDDPARMTATVSKTSIDGPIASARIQPGTRVRFIKAVQKEDDIVFETFYHRSGKEFQCIYQNGVRFYQDSWGSKKWETFPKRWYNEGSLRTDTIVRDDGTAERYNSGDDSWLVKWDNGTTGWLPTCTLEILKK